MENALKTTGYFMVRAMASTEADFNVFHANSVVAVGWGDIDFREYVEHVDDLVQRVREEYYPDPDLDQRYVGRKLAQVRRFMALKPGDKVVVPYYDAVWLCTVEGERRFAPGPKGPDLANQITVNYHLLPGSAEHKMVRRKDLSEALARRLRVRGSVVSDLDEFAEEIEGMFAQEAYTYSGVLVRQNELLREEFKARLLERIRSGATALETGGTGLEHLVADLFRTEGYKVSLPGKRFFKEGDADVEAVRSDMFHEVSLLAQVKHHSGITDRHGLDQLLQIKAREEDVERVYVLITTAALRPELVEEAQGLGVLTIDGPALMEWLMTRLDDLGSEWRLRLGISDVPRLVD
jgi:hypothetical protein